MLNICGIPVHSVDKDQVLSIVDRWLDEEDFHQIATVNPEFILETRKNSAFYQLLQKTSLNVADGVGLLWASTYLAKKSYGRLIDWLMIWTTGLTLIFCPDYCRKILKTTVTGVDLVKGISMCSHEDLRVFLLGGVGDTPFRAAQALRGLNSKLSVVGCCNRMKDENEAILAQIRASKATVLFVGFGAPFQDLWIEKYKDALPDVRVAIGVGGTFDYLSGRFKRAPRWLRALGLDWFYRLLTQPWQLKGVHGTSAWKRIYRIYQATWVFVHHIWREKQRLNQKAPRAEALRA